MTAEVNLETTELRRLCDAATPGPWLVRPLKHDDWGYIRAAENRIVAIARAGSDYEPDDYRRVGTDPSQHNADFIAAARTAIPALLAEVARLKAELVEARRLANISSAMWHEAENDVVALAEPIQRDDMLCFTRGTFDRMVEEKVEMEAEVARLKARLAAQRSWEGAAHEYEEQARHARETATTHEAMARAEEREACGHIAHNAGMYSESYIDDPPDHVRLWNEACWKIRDLIRARSAP